MQNIKRILLLTLVVVCIALFNDSVRGLIAAPKEKFDFSKISASDYITDEVLVKYRGQERFQRVKLSTGQTVPEMVGKLNQRKDVEYAEPNFKAFALQQAIVDDPLYERDPTQYPEYADQKYAQQWALNNTGKTGGSAGADINWEEAYSYLEGSYSASVVVAVVDSGLDTTHPDLDNKFIDTYSVLSDSPDVTDYYGHGTHVSGTVAAKTNNTKGVASTGFADCIMLLPIKVLNQDGVGTNADVADGIRFAADWLGASDEVVKVINLSVGSYFNTQAVEDEVNYAWDKGIILAAAAGNSGNRRRVYPAYYERVISVGGTDHNDNLYSFSTHNTGVDVSAPAVEVLSTFPTHEFKLQEPPYGRKQNYDVGSGTSMASPHVAGLAALLFAQDDNRTNTQVRTLIEQSVDDLGETGWDRYFGHGRINAHTALTTQTPTPLPTATPTPVEPTPTPTPGAGVCGDGFCAGNLEGEDCFTCLDDCRCFGTDCGRACCGNGILEPGENKNSCPVDLQ